MWAHLQGNLSTEMCTKARWKRVITQHRGNKFVFRQMAHVIATRGFLTSLISLKFSGVSLGRGKYF
jgi:hypothetical protein